MREVCGEVCRRTSAEECSPVCLNLGVKDGRNNNCISMYISTDSISSYTDREETMRSELFFFILYFCLWVFVSFCLGDYWVSADPVGSNNYPPAFPYVTGAFVVLYIITIILIRRVMTDD